MTLRKQSGALPGRIFDALMFAILAGFILAVVIILGRVAVHQPWELGLGILACVAFLFVANAVSDGKWSSVFATIRRTIYVSIAAIVAVIIYVQWSEKAESRAWDECRLEYLKTPNADEGDYSKKSKSWIC